MNCADEVFGKSTVDNIRNSWPSSSSATADDGLPGLDIGPPCPGV